MLMLTLAVLVSAGCGGSSSSSTTQSASAKANAKSATAPSRPLARHELIARADGICARLNKQLVSAKPKNNSRQEIERVAPIHAAAERIAVLELRGLIPPSTLARDWRLIVALRSQLASELVKLVRAAFANDTTAIKKLTASKVRAHEALLAVATRAGFKTCSQVG
jgi:hypothetical protein